MPTIRPLPEGERTYLYAAALQKARQGWHPGTLCDGMWRYRPRLRILLKKAQHKEKNKVSTCQKVIRFNATKKKSNLLYTTLLGSLDNGSSFSLAIHRMCSSMSALFLTKIAWFLAIVAALLIENRDGNLTWVFPFFRGLVKSNSHAWFANFFLFPIAFLLRRGLARFFIARWMHALQMNAKPIKWGLESIG